MQTRNNGPPNWRDAERPGRVSYLPPRVMTRTYRSELRRRAMMAAEAADWQRLDSEIRERLRSDAAIERLAAAFANCFASPNWADPTADAADGHHIKPGNDYGPRE